jgi:two-component system, cell cycle response regulator
MKSDVLDLIRKTGDLPSLPTVAIRVLALANDPEATLEQIAEVVRNDPALTARVLKVINSPLFGIPREITSIERAAGLLGMRRFKMMALSFSVMYAMENAGAPGGFDFQNYWRHSLTNAVASRLLADAVNPSLHEDAFVGGLLSDIGLLAGSQVAPDLYGPVFARWSESGSWSIEDELELIGVGHPAVSAALLDSWGLPEILCQAIAVHHGDRLDEVMGEAAKLAPVICAGTSITELFCGDISSLEIDACRERCIALTRINADRLEQLLDEVATRVLETATLLSVPVGETVSYAQIQAEAKQQLDRLQSEEAGSQ